MKKLKKALSLLLVGVIAVTSLFCGTVTASAASSKTSLIKTSVSSIDSKATGIQALGQDLYYATNDSYRAVYRIGEIELKSWRKTGKLKPKKVTIDSELKSMNWYLGNSSFTNGNYALINCYDKNYNITSNKVIKYDKSANKIDVIYTTKNNIGLSSDGYISEYSESKDGKKTYLKILSPEGKTIKTIAFDKSNRGGQHGTFFNGGKFLSISDYSLDNNGSIDYKEGHFYLIDQNGKKTALIDSPVWNKAYGSNYVLYSRMPRDESTVYLTNTKKTFDISPISLYTDSNNTFYSLETLGYEIYGNNAIGNYYNYNYKTSEYDYRYRLIDISQGVSADKGYLTAPYLLMLTRDGGRTFLVQKDNKKKGFINSKGKELAMFDNAGAFYGDGKYAPVIKNGKIYLVNKNMKKVSSTIKADTKSYVDTLGSELFKYTCGDKVYLMTIKS